MNAFEEGLLTYLSKPQLQKIQSCHVGIGGCGGLGSNVAVLLARCGFYRFAIMDFDIVEASNLNRQQFDIHDLGQLKALTLNNKLLAINPEIRCDTHHTEWRPDLDNDPFRSCDILVEAFDVAKTKAAFIDHYSDLVPNLVSGNGLAGFHGPALTVHRYDNVFFVGDNSSAVSGDRPPMAPRVTQCAAKMAEIILTLVLGAEHAYGDNGGSSGQ